MNRNFHPLTAAAALLAVPLAACDPLDDTAAMCAHFSSTLAVGNASGSTTFEMRITNNSDSNLTLTVPDGCSQVRFEVSNAAGMEVWASDDNIACTQALTSVTYSPGQTIAYSSTWDQKLRDDSTATAGQYRVDATDRTECGADLSKFASFNIP